MSFPPGLPPIFEHTPVVLASSELVAEFPPNTFLESWHGRFTTGIVIDY